MQLNSSSYKTLAKAFPFARERTLQLQSPLTLEKLGLKACKSCRVAK